jgi:hypothetical protein
MTHPNLPFELGKTKLTIANGYVAAFRISTKVGGKNGV